MSKKRNMSQRPGSDYMSAADPPRFAGHVTLRRGMTVTIAGETYRAGEAYSREEVGPRMRPNLFINAPAKPSAEPAKQLHLEPINAEMPESDED